MMAVIRMNRGENKITRQSQNCSGSAPQLWKFSYLRVLSCCLFSLPRHGPDGHGFHEIRIYLKTVSRENHLKIEMTYMYPRLLKEYIRWNFMRFFNIFESLLFYNAFSNYFWQVSRRSFNEKLSTVSNVIHRDPLYFCWTIPLN